MIDFCCQALREFRLSAILEQRLGPLPGAGGQAEPRTTRRRLQPLAEFAAPEGRPTSAKVVQIEVKKPNTYSI